MIVKPVPWMPINSAGLAAALSDETGTGLVVFNDSPSLVTPKSTTTIGVGNATPAASGAGITFPATQSASSNANTLDDYEEGTWTPTVYGGTTAGTYTVSTAASHNSYTKVGRKVSIQCKLQFSAASGGTGNLMIGELPFAYAIGASLASGCSFVNLNLTTANPATVTVNGAASVTDTQLTLIESTDAGAVVITPISGVSTSTTITFILTYFV